MRRLPACAALAAALLAPAFAAADDEGVEYWFNPSVSWDVDEATAFEIETAQRLRSASDGREDTYFARAWLNRDLSDAVTVSGGLERRVNEPGNDETRLLQQVSTRYGVWRTRVRLEQRFVDDRRTGVRLRTRAGVAVPVREEGPLTFVADAELFTTLRATSEGGDTGVTGLRTQIGLDYEVGDRLTLTLAYLRQQDFNRDGDDRVGHAPLVGVEVSY